MFSWTSMISGLAINGHSYNALELFLQIEVSSKILPNEVTFLGVLSACSYGGLVKEGYYYFGHMSRFYGLVPRLEHYGCIVDLLGRAKLLSEAEKFVRETTIEPDVVIWRSLLFARRANGDVNLSEFAPRKIVQLEPSKSLSHVLLSNIYAVASRWSDVYRVRREMNKQPSCSFIEVHGVVHEFFVADTSHCQTDLQQTLSGTNKLLSSEPYSVYTSDFFSYEQEEIWIEISAKS